jgi:hypothetical protein
MDGTRRPRARISKRNSRWSMKHSLADLGSLFENLERDRSLAQLGQRFALVWDSEADTYALPREAVFPEIRLAQGPLPPIPRPWESGSAGRAWPSSGGAAPRPTGPAPDYVVSPGGTAYPVPRGATGPAPADTGKGVQFQGGSGGPGLNERVTGFRFMDPVTRGRYQHPKGYGVYNNITDQTVSPSTGQTVPRSHPDAHIRSR